MNPTFTIENRCNVKSEVRQTLPEHTLITLAKTVYKDTKENQNKGDQLHSDILFFGYGFTDNL